MSKYPEVSQMVEDIETAAAVGSKRGGFDLDHWEERFVQTIKHSLATKRPLTEKQLVKLREIWDLI